MSEPVSAVAEGAAAAGIVITLTGSIFGLDFQSIAVGITGALIAQTLMPDAPKPDESQTTRLLRGILQITAAGLLAGVLSPLAESIIGGMLPEKIAAAPLHIAVAGIIGMTAPVVVPLLRRLVSTWKSP